MSEVLKNTLDFLANRLAKSICKLELAQLKLQKILSMLEKIER
ncbi:MULTISPECIES: hypothetical protein [Bacillus]|nr:MULTISPECIES: hypothetical protein [Bacillus]MCS7399533.1 hypothetical protein [Bacillus subtilis]MCW0120946.1 hypothetical protein [Bacillus subtilis]MDI6564320.1 hypothetical protein [Bacillus subtilis]MDN4181373.1 hypothetical protein [Bacillus subtilis]MEC2334196.1 hypothetical protein [Bacillus subtilis]